MVNVAKDQAPVGADLPSAAPSASPAREPVGGVTLADLLSLPSLADAEPAQAGDLHRAVVRASLLGATAEPRHHLVCAEAGTVQAWEDAGREPVTQVALGGATALVVVGGHPDQLDRWRGAAASQALPLVVAATRVRAEQVVTEVLDAVLDQQSGILERVEETHRILVEVVLAGGGLEDLCRRLAEFLGGAAMVTSSDGRVLAQAGSDHEVAAALALDCFDRTGRLVTEREPVGIRPPDAPNARRAMVRIAAGQTNHGLLALFVEDRPLTADDVHLLERAATVAALAITKEQAVSAVESKYRAEFLRDALSGRAGPATEAVAHAAALGWDIDRRLVVVVAETDEDDTHTSRPPEEVSSLQHRFARAWSQTMAVRDVKAPVVGFSQEVVALFAVPDQADTDAIMRTVAEVVRVVRGIGGGGRRTFSTGVSRPIESVADLPQAYDEALSAVSVGRQLHGDSAVTHFDQLGIFRLLALIPDSADLRRFVDEALGDLARDDSPENADLRRTLSILIDTNMNVAETARLMFFHYNTLRYRIAKLEKLLGPFTSDPQLRLKLALALKVHQMRGI
ncbi:CdaR family transcriptional regulator [Nostocoides sp. HKS02]|uniref:PucR family transcriptional regulator n=1 Tax=Nostocoides sp. HKS02 TaxID=1813880 RepID=UPI0012B4E35C|nr:helix-turn-helix domain-containing protein [Tetrasphaera sp. HKS02]QGN56575.1 PucR family transcriptional regulator [Tetrasphaera sp. HKS02]